VHLASSLSANPIGADHLLNSFGLIGLAVILFAECGLLVGFFLPGDTILLAAGIELSLGTLHNSLWAFLVLCPIAAVAGNIAGYWIGYRAGPVVFDRPQSRLFKPEYVTRAQVFFDRFGWPTVLIARFVPIVRTVAPVMAGVSRMRFPRFGLASVLGGVVWTDGVLLAGYWLGRFKFVRDNKGYIDAAVVVMVVISLVPTAVHLLRTRRPRTPESR
jgi:membrane-associated protein